jgi:hypothetical protein
MAKDDRHEMDEQQFLEALEKKITKLKSSGRFNKKHMNEFVMQFIDDHIPSASQMTKKERAELQQELDAHFSEGNAKGCMRAVGSFVQSMAGEGLAASGKAPLSAMKLAAAISKPPTEEQMRGPTDADLRQDPNPLASSKGALIKVAPMVVSQLALGTGAAAAIQKQGERLEEKGKELQRRAYEPRPVTAVKALLKRKKGEQSSGLEKGK